MSWLPKRTVLVPIDFSKDSVNALKHAQQFVSEDTGLHVLHVLEPSYALQLGDLDDAHREKNIHDALDKCIEQCGIAGAHTVVRSGSPAHEIAQYASDIHAELIIIPCLGDAGISQALIGSVAERVVRHAPCPVLVLR